MFLSRTRHNGSLVPIDLLTSQYSAVRERGRGVDGGDLGQWCLSAECDAVHQA